jgi:ubiquinone/menaquinone biosynthesis C-methylase UbiE/uncharacterized protein YbaR (Trm112 family)
MESEKLNILVCQQCLGEVYRKADEIICNNCMLSYPISGGLIYMGYDINRREETEAMILESMGHQAKLEEMDKHYSYAYPSYKAALLSIRLLKDDINTPFPVAIDIGCGGAPFDKMFDEAGFETYSCEIDPNSLYLRALWSRAYPKAGRNIVCDARILPFRDSSADVIFCKEFIHHIRDYNALFLEVNRVLKEKGIFVIIEPTLTLTRKLLCPKSLKEGFSHHYETIYRYYFALKKNGFKVHRYYFYFYSQKSKRLKFFKYLRKYFHNQIYLKTKTTPIGLFIKMLVQSILNSNNIMFARKIKDIPGTIERPRIQVIEPRHLILNENCIGDARLEKFNVILDDVYREVADQTKKIKPPLKSFYEII